MLVHSRAGAPGCLRHGRPVAALCLHTASLKLPLAGVPAKQLQAAPAASGRRLRLPYSTLRVRAYLNQQQQQYPAQYGSYSHTLGSSSTAATAKLTKGAYLFEVHPDDPSKPQTFQTEQAMLARYSHLLKESGLMDNLKARAHFERPRDKAQRRRQQRIEQHKWQRKQTGYAPESLESAGGPDMVLEEPYEEFFDLRAAWDTATDPGEAPWAQQLAEQQQQQQQQATYGYYAYEPNNVVDLGAYMPPGSELSALAGGSGEFGGYMAGGSSSSSSSSSSVPGGYSSSSSSSAAAPAGWGLEYVNPGSYASMAAATAAVAADEQLFAADDYAASMPGEAFASTAGYAAAHPAARGFNDDVGTDGFFSGGYAEVDAAALPLQASWPGLVDLEQLDAAAAAASPVAWQQQQQQQQQQQYGAWQQQQQAWEQQQAAWQQQQQELWQQQQALQDAAAAAAASQQQASERWLQQQQQLQYAETASQLEAAGQGVAVWMGEAAAEAAADAADAFTNSGYCGSAGWPQFIAAEVLQDAWLQQQLLPGSEGFAAAPAAAGELAELLQQAAQMSEPALLGTAALTQQQQQQQQQQQLSESQMLPETAIEAAAPALNGIGVALPSEAQPAVPATADVAAAAAAAAGAPAAAAAGAPAAAAAAAAAGAAAPSPSAAEPAVTQQLPALMADKAQQAGSAAAAAAAQQAAAVPDPCNTEEIAAPTQQQRRRRQPQAKKDAAAATGKAAAAARPAAAAAAAGNPAAKPKSAASPAAAAALPAAAAAVPAAAAAVPAAAVEPRPGQLTAAGSAAALREAQAALDASMAKLQQVTAALAAKGLQLPAPTQQQQQQQLAGGSTGDQAAAARAAGVGAAATSSSSSGGRSASPGQFRRIGRKQQGAAAASEAAAGASGSSSSSQPRVRQGSKGGSAGGRGLKGPIVLDGQSFTAAAAGGGGGGGAAQGSGAVRVSRQKKAGAAGSKPVV